jgi:transposase-like protein
MKRHDEDQMRSLYQQWLDSGQSKTRFAHTQGIIPTVFYYWVKKFQRQQPGLSFSSGLTGFHQIALDQSPVKSVNQPLARICYPSGVCIDLYQMPDTALLRSLAG